MIEQIPGSAARDGWRQRLFAWMTRISEEREYEQSIAPYRRALLGDLKGTVLEIGAGTGANFAYYPRGIRWIGIEPNVFMHPHLIRTANEYGITGEVRSEVAERLPVDDASVDAAVSTFVLCSVSNPDRTLREILRALRPGGYYVFVEHVAAPEHTRLHSMQKLIKPVWRAVSDGCEPDRDTAATIERAGFSRVEIQEFHAPAPIVSPHIAGKAVK